LAWKIEISRTAEKQIRKLDRRVQIDIVHFLKTRLDGVENPRKLGRILRGEKTGLWRYRIGSYRLICYLEENVETVVALEAGHRKDIYRS